MSDATATLTATDTTTDETAFLAEPTEVPDQTQEDRRCPCANLRFGDDALKGCLTRDKNENGARLMGRKLPGKDHGYCFPCQGRYRQQVADRSNRQAQKATETLIELSVKVVDAEPGLLQRISFLRDDEQLEAQQLFCEYEVLRDAGSFVEAWCKVEEIKAISNARQTADIAERAKPLLEYVKYLPAEAKTDLAIVCKTAELSVEGKGLAEAAKGIPFKNARELLRKLEQFVGGIQAQREQVQTRRPQPPTKFTFAKQR